MAVSIISPSVRPAVLALVAVAVGLAAVLLLPTKSFAGKVPAGNVVDNPTFNEGASGWSGLGAKLAAVRDRRAPDGRMVARVSGRGRGKVAIDDASPSVSPTVSGSSYLGTAWVKGSAATAGRKVHLVLREVNAEGQQVGESSRSVRLPRGRFREVEVTRRAVADGSSIAVSIRHKPKNAPKAVFFADAISVTPVAPSPVRDGSSHVTTSQIAIVNDQEDQLFVADGSQYRYIAIRDSMEYRLEELRAAHPESEILLYKDVSFTADDGCEWAPFQGPGLDYCEADPHENWFLHRKSNPQQRLASEGYEYLRAMNIGDGGYQQAWADSVLSRLGDAHDDGSGARYDGVWMDDTNLFPGHGMDGGIAELSDAQYRQATVSFIETVAPQLEAAGFKTVANLGMDPWDPAQRSAAISIARVVSTVNREGLVRWGEDGTLFTTDGDAPFWKHEVETAEDMQAAGADLHAITYGSASDVRGQRYSRATFLMAWDGSDGGALNYRTSESSESWRPDWTMDVGVPTGPRQGVGRGFLRRYSGGIVAINPASGGSQSFSLGGSFRDPDGGGCVSSISLGATRGAVLAAC